MILDLEIGTGRDDILALFDGRPRFMRIVDISIAGDTNGRTLTFAGGDATCLQVKENGMWKCIALVGYFPDHLIRT